MTDNALLSCDACVVTLHSEVLEVSVEICYCRHLT
jgi:hypothetical protein